MSKLLSRAAYTVNVRKEQRAKIGVYGKLVPGVLILEKKLFLRKKNHFSRYCD
jgi:hypothetical protein